MASIEFDRMTKRFGDHVAVRELSLEVADGEFLALVGPSGCGKSTTLRVLAGLEHASSGSVRINGREVNAVPAKDRDLAMVFQSYALYPHMSVFENMAFALRLRGQPREEIQARVASAATLLDIADLLHQKPGQLSGGQRQRVALGRAIVREPAAFLLDEPLSNLDAQLRVQTRAELGKLHRRLAATFVYVTHDQVEAMTMADRIAVLDGGVLQQVASPQELYERPANAFVAGFIGSPAMNFFEVTVRSDPSGMCLEGAGFQLELPAAIAPTWRTEVGRRLLLGVRPEHLYDAAFVPNTVTSSAVVATVDLVEHLGSEVLVHMDLGRERLVARLDPRTRTRPEEELRVVLDLAAAHAFEPTDGLVLPHLRAVTPQA